MPITVPSGSTFTRNNRSRMWLIMLGVLALLTVIAWGILSMISAEVRRQITETLESTLEIAKVTSDRFFARQSDTAMVIANGPVIRTAAAALFAGDEAQRPALNQRLNDTIVPQQFDGWALASVDGRIIASGLGANGWPVLPPALHARIAEVIAGKVVLLPPSWVSEGNSRRPAFLLAAPIRDGERTIGILALTMDPVTEFSAVLESARFGKTGETYACTSDGLLASRSRYLTQLKDSGLIPKEAPNAILRLGLRRPPTVVDGRTVSGNPGEWPFTTAAAGIIAKTPGLTLDQGFDYRGIPVVVAWKMLGETGMGVITKIDSAEAFRPLALLRGIFLSVLALLAIATVASVLWMSNLARLSHKLAKAQGQLQQLGQYTLEQKLGEGGMGAVYRGRHALMRRPTAIKLITGKITDDVLARFEREVQLCCRLSHPNTIAIYDYGRTADGTFYYAMELLDGMDLEAMVGKYGPLPAARVIHFLVQACGSLAEAHDLQMIHRDIKPANLFITNRGGENDVLKVLDFGLVKSTENNAPQLSRADIISGTPPYMAPEVIEQKPGIDGRSDLYALACVGYFLLTGKCPFERASAMETLMAHINEPPAPLSSASQHKIPSDLEAVILHGLAKDPAKRQASVRAFRDDLLTCADAKEWREADAEKWWVSQRAKAADEADKNAKKEVSVSMVLKTADLEFKG